MESNYNNPGKNNESLNQRTESGDKKEVKYKWLFKKGHQSGSVTMTGRRERMGKAVHKESLDADLVHRVNGGVFNLDII